MSEVKAPVEHLPDDGAPSADAVDAANTSAPGAPTNRPSDDTSKIVGDPSVQALDKALADDLDSLLQGDFESVDDVLAGVFDEKTRAPARPRIEEPADPVAPFADAASALQSAPADDETESAADVAPDHMADPLASFDFDDACMATPEEITGSLDGGDDESVATGVAAPRVDVTADDGPPLPADAVPTPAVVPAAAIEPETHGAEPEPVPAAAPRGPKPAEPVVEITDVEPAPDESTAIDDDDTPGLDDAPDVSDPDASDEPASAGPLDLAIATVRSLVVSALALANWPMRLVPDRFRPTFDWIALTLVFWVPVVWAIVLVGRH